MAEEESDVFEITDFTTASEWERFISKLDEIIHEWKLTGAPSVHVPLEKGELTWAKWEEQSEEIQFADFRFVLARHYIKKDNINLDDHVAETPEVENKNFQGKTNDGETEHIPSTWLDMMAEGNDFPGRAHCLCRWYGLRDFLVLFPAQGMDDIMTESRANILLSSVAVAINNSSCQVPIFVQIHSKWRKLYRGHFEIPGFRTEFEMVHLKNTPKQYNHLAGLLDVFKGKLACPVSPVPPVSLAARFTYVLQDWALYNWSQAPPDIESSAGVNIGLNEFGDLPFGACEDPVADLQLSTTWPNLSEEMVVDDDAYSDLNPLQAPYWSVKVRMIDDNQCLMGDYLEEFIHLCRRKESTDQLLGKSIMQDTKEEINASHALNRLTDPAYNLPAIGDVVTKTTTVVTKATSKLQIKPEEAPIPTDLLNDILMYLFPDAKEDLQKIRHPDPLNELAKDEQSGNKSNKPDVSSDKDMNDRNSFSNEKTDNTHDMHNMFKQFKSAPSSSLTYRLGVVMCIVNHSYGGVRAVAHLWQEFVLEMRYRLENNINIPDLETGTPNMGCSLLHQKLQMLNCCIERKRGREAHKQNVVVSQRNRRKSAGSDEGEIVSMKKSKNSLQKSEGWEWEVSSLSSDDEFFECENDETPMETSDTIPKVESSDKCNAKFDRIESSSQETDFDSSFSESLTHMPEGRMSAYLHFTLLNNMKEPLYVPFTQEPAPMTEDMLEEHAEVLAKLGTSQESQHLRARMQSACLLSDMESFKAANPGCVLADFVRWYSPRDWIETEEMDENGIMVTKGQLSQRMQIPGNMWVEVWNSAKPTPARRQRRLFDDTKEAEKVLHWLASMKPSSVAMRLMPVVVHAAVSKLVEQDESHLNAVHKVTDKVSQKAARVMRAPHLEVTKFEEVIHQLIFAEQLITRAQSLQQKFAHEKEGVQITSKDIQNFVSDLLELPEVCINGAAQSPVGTIIHRLFQAAQKSAYMISIDDEDEESNTDFQPEPTALMEKRSVVPDFPRPAGKEYILRTHLQRPTPWSRCSPQRMYCILLKNEFRLLGAFSFDTTFQ